MVEPNTHTDNLPSIVAAVNMKTLSDGKHVRLNPAESYLATLGSFVSQVTVASRLNIVARLVGCDDLTKCDWEKMTYAAVLKIMHDLRTSGRGPATINAILSAVKQVARQAWLLHMMDKEDYLRIKELRQLRNERLPEGRVLSMSDSHNLLNFPENEKNTGKSVRDKAIIALMLGCGLRRAEVPPLKYEDLCISDASLKLIGKGNKERIVFLPDQTLEYMKAWLEIRGNEKGVLFGRVFRSGRISLKEMNPSTIEKLLKSHLKEAGVVASTHDLRRTFATRMLDKVDVLIVKEAMGHASVNTTARYDKRGIDKRKNVRNLMKL